MFTITRSPTHLRVEIRGPLTRDLLARALRETMESPGYADLNDVWDVGDGPVRLNMADVTTLVEGVAAIYPMNARRSRTAVVTRSGFVAAIAELWRATASDLPFQMRVFADVEEAEAWITGKMTCA
jgi:hypothetical protein